MIPLILLNVEIDTQGQRYCGQYKQRLDICSPTSKCYFYGGFNVWHGTSNYNSIWIRCCNWIYRISYSTDGSKNDRLRPLLNTTLILNNHFLCSNQQTYSHFELLVFMFDTSCIISALLWPFFFCYFANSVTNTIGSIGDIAYNSNWYDFPPNVQKHIMLVIARSQDSVYFSGLGLVRCTLEVYGEVSDSISS